MSDNMAATVKRPVQYDDRPSDVSSSIGAGGKRVWIYPDIVRGRFSRARDIVYGFLIVLYVAVPWMTIGGSPVLRFNLPGRRFHIFGATFVATDLFLLALFLLIATFFLFLFSAVLGRLWCGWGCPQTVYLDGVFRKIERWIEGTPRQRKKLDSGPRDDLFYQKKVAKHTAFFLISAFLSVSFIAYFTGPSVAFGLPANLGSGHPIAFAFALGTTALVYFNFGWFREQFCVFLCPYARLQSVLLDKHSLIIGYDVRRGEPRAPIRHGNALPVVQGDCIDCKRCVQVCPTGIDIRQGLQLECVNCTACIDACDMVMDKIGRPRGLIRYASLIGLGGGSSRLARPRVIAYTVVLLLFTGLFAAQLVGREVLEFAVVRPPGVPYLVQEDKQVRNMFQLYVTNTDEAKHVVEFKVSGPDGLHSIIPGSPFELDPDERVKAEAFVLLPAEAITRESSPLHFQVLLDGEPLMSRMAQFLGPVHEPGHDDHEKDEEEDSEHEQD